MNTIKDGGPAFPGKASINRNSGELQPHQFGNDDFETLGMSLRDHFAGLAMHRLISLTLEELNETYPEADGSVSVAAYMQADAMLHAREN